MPHVIPQHVTSVLTAAGLPQEKIDELVNLPDDQVEAFKPEDVVGLIHTGIETKIKNDPKFWEGLDEKNVNEGFRKKIEGQQFARVANIARDKVLKALGVSEDDLSDLTEEERNKYEVVITKAAQKFATSKASDKELQKQLIETRKKLEEIETAGPEKEQKLRTELEGKFNNDKLDFIFLAELSSIPGLKAPAGYIVKAMADELRNSYAFVVDGIKALPKQKDKSSLDVVEGTKVLSTKDLMMKILERDGLLEKTDISKKKVEGKTKVEIDAEDGNLAISSHILDKIKENTPSA